MRTFAEATEALKQNLPGYEDRSQQTELAEAIEKAIADRSHLLGQAPTGTGKSLAYLIPAILAGQRVIVSTETKALQTQVWCVTPNTKVLTAELRHVPAESLYVGQHLLGFDEERVGNRRNFRDSVVESIREVEKPCYELEFDDGTTITCSADHQWLTARSGEVRWMTTERMVPTAGKRLGSKVIRLTDVWDEETSYESGYIAGVFDGEGTFRQRKTEIGYQNVLSFSQVDNELLERMKKYLADRGIGFSEEVRRREKPHHQDCSIVRIRERRDIIRVLGECRPQRLLSKFDPDLLGTIPAVSGGSGRGQRLIRKTFVGYQKVLAIQTSTKTFIAEGLASHNCKDVPFLQEHLGIEFTAALLKGRSNYLCVNLLETIDPADLPIKGRLMEVATGEGGLANPNFSGERDDLGFEIEDREWSKIAASTDGCQAFECSKNGICYAQVARDRAQEADVVIVNHALYLTDLVVKMATGGFADLLGEHSIVIFDEAHSLEEVAGNTFGATFRERGIRALCSEVKNFAMREGFTPVDTTELLGNLNVLWGTLKEGRIKQADLVANADAYVNFANSLIDLAEGVDKWVPSYGTKKKHNRLSRRVNSAAERFQKIITDGFDVTVRYVEKDKDDLVLRTAPIHVGEILRENLFATNITAILVSATLANAGKFDFVAGRLGIDNYRSIEVESPFNFQEQARLYVPTDLPDPSKDKAAWSSMATSRMLDLVRMSEGRALLLFTSVTEMRAAYETISERVEYTCLVQGSAPNRILMEQFKEDTHSILFATKSFFTGIDIQGESLSLLVMNRLPFPVPTEPLIEARCEAIKARGGNDFSEYTIPFMSLTLQQGVGRAIRTKTDRAVMAILDSRLLTKGYGKGLIRTLPPAPIVTEMREVEPFLTSL